MPIHFTLWIGLGVVVFFFGFRTALWFAYRAAYIRLSQCRSEAFYYGRLSLDEAFEHVYRAKTAKLAEVKKKLDCIADNSVPGGLGYMGCSDLMIRCPSEGAVIAQMIEQLQAEVGELSEEVRLIELNRNTPDVVRDAEVARLQVAREKAERKEIRLRFLLPYLFILNRVALD